MIYQADFLMPHLSHQKEFGRCEGPFLAAFLLFKALLSFQGSTEFTNQRHNIEKASKEFVLYHGVSKNVIQK